MNPLDFTSLGWIFLDSNIVKRCDIYCLEVEIYTYVSQGPRHDTKLLIL